MRNYMYLVDQYVSQKLRDTVARTFGDKNYEPDYELGLANDRVYIVRTDRYLVQELESIVAFLNADFETSESF